MPDETVFADKWNIPNLIGVFLYLWNWGDTYNVKVDGTFPFYGLSGFDVLQL